MSAYLIFRNSYICLSSIVLSLKIPDYIGCNLFYAITAIMACAKKKESLEIVIIMQGWAVFEKSEDKNLLLFIVFGNR